MEQDRKDGITMIPQTRTEGNTNSCPLGCKIWRLSVGQVLCSEDRPAHRGEKLE